MRISWYTPKENIDVTRGYGQAGFNIVTSMQRCGYDVPFNVKDAPCQISFAPPTFYKWRANQYQIGYTPWESTELPDGWLKKMNRCDEVWATSQWVADVYGNCGVKPDIHVYPHGVAPSWQPVKRQVGDVITFLHIGEPALRKGGQMALDAFRAAFGDRKDVRLIIKCYMENYLRVWKNGRVMEPAGVYDNVTIINDMYNPSELRQLYADADVMIYPSYGEGFGLIPIQALATGLPTISTAEWAPYKNFIRPLEISGSWNRSIWSVHPGDVYYPDYDVLIDTMKYTVDNIEKLQSLYYAQAPEVIKEYDWDKITKRTLKHLENLF